MNIELGSFLARHTSFDGWTEEWAGVPLASRVYLSDELPPRAFIGSVRAMVLRGNDVLLVHSSVPILSVGGRPEAGETLEGALCREVAEETGWLVSPFCVLGFIHTYHLDEQRPDWGRPAPDFLDPLFAVEAISFGESLKKPDEHPSEFVPIRKVASLGIHTLEQTFLRKALKNRLHFSSNPSGNKSLTK